MASSKASQQSFIISRRGRVRYNLNTSSSLPCSKHLYTFPFPGTNISHLKAAGKMFFPLVGYVTSVQGKHRKNSKPKIHFEFAMSSHQNSASRCTLPKKSVLSAKQFVIHAVWQKTRSSHYKRELRGPYRWPYEWESGVVNCKPIRSISGVMGPYTSEVAFSNSTAHGSPDNMFTRVCA